MRLARRSGTGRRITLVPLIDVLFILLVYFMVTSVYRNLDMIPVVQADTGKSETVAGSDKTLLLRITAEGEIVVRGKLLDDDALARVLAQAQSRVLILPAGSAPLWGLTKVMDAATLADIADVRLVRLEVTE